MPVKRKAQPAAPAPPTSPKPKAAALPEDVPVYKMVDAMGPIHRFITTIESVLVCGEGSLILAMEAKNVTS